MLKNIHTGEFLEQNVWGGYHGGQPNSIQSSGFGMLRFNNNSNCIEVYDGMGWQSIAVTSEIKLNNEAIELLHWARAQKKRQDELERMAQENATIKDALDSYRRAEERVNILQILCEQDKISYKG